MLVAAGCDEGQSKSLSFYHSSIAFALIRARQAPVHPPERGKDLEGEWTTGVAPNADSQIVSAWVAFTAAASSHKSVPNKSGRHQ